MNDTPGLDECRQLVARLAQQHAWSLTDAQLLSYAHALLPLLTKIPTERWPIIVGHFHNEHNRVQALRDANHPNHDQEWTNLVRYARQVLQHLALLWSYDRAIESDDVVQAVCLALNKALPSYRYHSLFTTWAHSVIVWASRDDHRGRGAKRRSAPLFSLDELTDDNHPTQRETPFEDEVSNVLLQHLCKYILRQQKDKRLVVLFDLSFVRFWPTADIAQVFRMSESRARALIKQIRDMLVRHPDIIRWRYYEQDR